LPPGAPDGGAPAPAPQSRRIRRAEDTLELYLAALPDRGGIIYLTGLVLFFGALSALPLVRVPVSLEASGSIRPLVERHDVRAAAAGVVGEARLRDGRHVERGELLVALDSIALGAELQRLREALAEQHAVVADLSELVRRAAAGALAPADVETPRYLAELLRARAELRTYDAELTHAGRELERIQSLRQAGFATEADLDMKRLEVERARLARASVTARWHAQWETELDEARERMSTLHGQSIRGQASLRERRIVAPTTGSLQEVRLLAQGSTVQPGELVATISPDRPLVAELFVPARDVGVLRIGAPVTIRVDALRSRDWGRVHGRVSALSPDVLILDGAPMFRVRCTLDEEHLALPGGGRVALRKGMTLVGRFPLGRRTLLQLIRDRTADWVDRIASA
jgi:HlyD family secretion protein